MKTILKKASVLCLALTCVLQISCSSNDSDDIKDPKDEPKVEVDYSFKRNVVLEYYTATWCAWCPSAADKVKKIKKQKKNIFSITHHPSNYKDIMWNKYSQVLLGWNEISFYPTVDVDRKKWLDWSGTIDENDKNRDKYVKEDKILELFGKESYLGVKLNSKVASNVSLDIEIQFAKTYDNKIKLSAFVLEDGIVADQSNNNPNLGKNPIVGYEHNDVLRYSFTNPLGDVINAKATKKGNIFKKQFKISIPKNVKDKSKLAFVVMVTDGETNEVLNARYVKANQSNEFEKIKNN